MKLSDLSTASAHDGGAAMEVVHPDLGPLEGHTITLAGLDSKRFIDKNREITDRRISMTRKMTAKELDAEQIEILAACTIAWTGFEKDDGTPLDCTEKAAFRLYADHGFVWLKRQVDSFIADRANFKKASPKS